MVSLHLHHWNQYSTLINTSMNGPLPSLGYIESTNDNEDLLISPVAPRLQRLSLGVEGEQHDGEHHLLSNISPFASPRILRASSVPFVPDSSNGMQVFLFKSKDRYMKEH